MPNSALDWSQCAAVESIPGKMGGEWSFKNTRFPVSLVFDNLEAGKDIAPRGLAQALPLHEVVEARAQVWAILSNGDLLKASESAGFEVFVTPDQNIRYQQNLAGWKIALVVLSEAQ